MYIGKYFFFYLQKMPPEPAVLIDIRKALISQKAALNKLMSREEFFKFLTCTLPSVHEKVGHGRHLEEVLRTLTDVLHIECDVSFVKHVMHSVASVTISLEH